MASPTPSPTTSSPGLIVVVKGNVITVRHLDSSPSSVRFEIIQTLVPGPPVSQDVIVYESGQWETPDTPLAAAPEGAIWHFRTQAENEGAVRPLKVPVGTRIGVSLGTGQGVGLGVPAAVVTRFESAAGFEVEFVAPRREVQ